MDFEKAYYELFGAVGAVITQFENSQHIMIPLSFTEELLKLKQLTIQLEEEYINGV